MNIKDINLETCPFCDGGATMREDGIHMPVINCGAYGKGRIYHLEYTKLADSERGRL